MANHITSKPELDLSNLLDDLVAGNINEDQAIEVMKTSSFEINKKDFWGNFFIFDCCHQKYYKLLTHALLDEKIKINQCNDDGYTTLMLASENGDISALKILLKYRSLDFNINIKGKTALDLAKNDESKELIEKAIKKQSKPWIEILTLLEGIKNGKISKEKALELIQKTSFDENAKDKNGETVLMLAIKGEYLEIVQELIKVGADLEEKDSLGKTALMLASIYGRTEVVEELIKAGADLEAKDSLGKTALMLASIYGRTEVVEELIKAGADVNAKSVFDETALMMASLCGRTEVVEELIKAGADLNAKDKNNETALIWASQNGHIEVVEELIKAGADVNAKDKDGETALIKASENGHIEVVEELLKDKRVKVNTTNNDGNTALDLATNNEIKQLIQNALDKQKQVEILSINNLKDKTRS